MEIDLEIIELIKQNRISTTEVADALGKSGGIPNVSPLCHSKFAVGKIRLITPRNNSNYIVHEEAERVNPGEIVYIKPIDFSNVAVFGDLVAKYILLYKQASAIVVEGNVRDTARLVKENYPIWSMGSNPVGAVNNKTHSDANVNISEFDELKDGIGICDEGGVVVIPANKINEETYRKLKHIEQLEDLWHYCLNTLKWSTFDIVVKKRYLIENDEIPRRLLNGILNDEKENFANE